MLTALLITLREGLEAALVLALTMSFLGRMGADSQKRMVWMGALAAAGLSLVAGGVLYFALGEMSEEAGEIIEVIITPVAVGVLTYMILWMKRRGAGMKVELEQKTRAAALSASPFALAALAFAAVGREGLETVLFLFGGLSAAGGAATLAGGLVGLALAVIVGVGLYQGSARLNLRTFFSVTGVLLIVMAAGIVGNLLGELEELGLPAFLTWPVWDASALLSDEGGLGALLKSLFGYQSAPALIQVLGYAGYLSTMLWLYLRSSVSGKGSVAVGAARE